VFVATGRAPCPPWKTTRFPPRRLVWHRPPTLANVAEQTPAYERGVLRATVVSTRPSQVPSRDGMVVAHFLKSGQRRRLRLGRVEERTAYIWPAHKEERWAPATRGTREIRHEKGSSWGCVATLGSGPGRPGFSPTRRERLFAHGDSRERVREGGKVDYLLPRGVGPAIEAQGGPPGTGCRPGERYPEE